MMILAGNTLSDLSRNSALPQELDEQRSARVARDLLAGAEMRTREAMHKRELENQMGMLQAELGNRKDLWNTPNATQAGINSNQLAMLQAELANRKDLWNTVNATQANINDTQRAINTDALNAQQQLLDTRLSKVDPTVQYQIDLQHHMYEDLSPWQRGELRYRNNALLMSLMPYLSGYPTTPLGQQILYNNETGKQLATQTASEANAALKLRTKMEENPLVTALSTLTGTYGIRNYWNRNDKLQAAQDITGQLGPRASAVRFNALSGEFEPNFAGMAQPQPNAELVGALIKEIQSGMGNGSEDSTFVPRVQRSPTAGIEVGPYRGRIEPMP